MVIGDPNKFSVIIDIVDKWSSNGFIAGLFYISIDGCIFPTELVNTTLNSEIYMFFKNTNSSLLTKPVNIPLFHNDKLSAYKELYRITFPEQDDTDNYIENNYLYYCGFDEMENNSCYIFLVSDGYNVRILGSKFNDNLIEQEDYCLSENNIREVFISISELDNIIDQLKEYYNNFLHFNNNRHTWYR